MVTTSFRWDIPPSVMVDKLSDYKKNLLQAIFQLGKVFAARMEAYARSNARWTDRTGNARQGLTGKAVKTAAGVIIYLFHKMTYGIWLEIAHAGKYAIILETLETHHPEIMTNLERLVKGT
jgi:hypothetical protein